MPTNYIHKEGYNPKEENPNDFFPTPKELCTRAIIDFLPDYTLRRGIKVLDAGAGTGRWGTSLRQLWPNVDLTGVDLPNINYAVQTPYNSWIEKDYRALTLDDVGGKLFDIVIGNPPYSTTQGKRDMHLAEKFVEKSFELIKPYGIVLFFLRTDFLAGAYRQQKFWPKYPPKQINICAERVNFFPDRGTGQTHNHMVVEWRKIPDGVYDLNHIVNFWSWRDE